MSTIVEPSTFTTEQLLAMPDDGMERWLIDGELREKPMAVRNRFHSKILISVGTVLKMWCDQQPQPRGEVMRGGSRDPPPPEPGPDSRGRCRVHPAGGGDGPDRRDDA